MGHTPTSEGGDNPTIMAVSVPSINEGETLTTTVTTLNQSTKTYYLLSGAGIAAADFSSGSLMLEGTGNFTFAHTFANDSLTEGTEFLKIQLFNDSERKNLFSTQLVEIKDTSRSPAIITRTVTVKPKTTQHQYPGTGSGLGYYLDGIESPLLTLIPGKTYRFSQDDSSNTNHQLQFYATADRATSYTTNVTTVGTAGSPGAYTEVVVTDATPVTLHYQCVNHGYMGNAILVHPKPIIYGNSLYTIVDGPSWTQAEENAKRLGGNLATIDDYNEDFFLFSNTEKSTSLYGDWQNLLWIGLTDQREEGVWEWISGSNSNYRNWNGMPDDEHGGQDYALTNWYGFGWQDGGGPGATLENAGGITETPFIRRGDSAYVIVSGPTWEEAEANAVKLGGHLVTINDAAEQTFLDSWSPDEQLWTGLTDREEEGVWKWISEESLSYTNWNPEAVSMFPYNTQYTIEKSNGAYPEGEDYVLIYAKSSTHSRQWDDGVGRHDHGTWLNKGIAEIKLTPNNIPTGTPTVTGTLKVGSTLTIDATTIQDSDNFTGYTPTLKYNWETSTDGTTWSKLTSTDGADNNNTYILTAAETSKKIRGVVSYLDGYGTQESVASTSYAVTESTSGIGRNGGYLTLSGTAQNDPWQYVVIQDSPSLSISGEYTVASWVYRSNAGGDWRNLYDIPDAHLLEFSPNGGFDWRAENNKTDFNVNGNVLPEGQWHHVAATMVQSGSSYIASVYVDGQLVTSADNWQLGKFNNSTGVRDSSGNLYLGILWSQRYGNPDPWAGSIDDFKIWNTGLSGADVQAVASNDSNVKRENLVAEYTFNNDTATTAFDSSGHNNHGTIVSASNPPNTAPPILTIENPGVHVRGNSLYTIVDGPSWTQAEANSVKLGGHLVSINDSEENEFVGNELGADLWIGINDEDGDRKWEWSNGDTVIYTNWSPGQPDQGPQEYGVLWNRDSHLGWDNQTNDAFEWENHRRSGIAETPFIRRGDSAYVIVSGPTWEEAEANAVKLGGHLVTINDEGENEWISSQSWNGGPSLYIGYSDRIKEGDWRWADGSSSDFTSWSSNEPSNGITLNLANGEDYATVISGSKNWFDISNEFQPGIHSTLFGIAEIKLAPNNTPTGTPTVTGTLKVGSTLTIDATAIKDSDNFTGYTPTFKYNWETSTDGTTWSKLTTTDGADNNNTYILTAAEANKKIRGVVSYLNGYGTNEVVNSAASAPITSSAPPVQSLTLNPPSKTAIRSGINTTSAISYTVSTGEINLTGVGASLYFDSTQLSVSIAGDPFKTGLLGNAITADTSNADGDAKTDKVLSLSYADFGGNFPGSGATLPLTLANLNLVPTASYTGTTLHLKATYPAMGYIASGADLTLGYNASPVVISTLPALSTNRDSAFSYTVPSTLFSDSDSTLNFSATTATGASLPSWLSFNPATRTLSGTPTTGGTLNLNLSASDELGSVSTPLSIKVREVQQLSSSTTTIRYQRNEDLTVSINYSTTDGSSSTGLAFKVHFNSNLFSFNPSTGVSNKLAAAGLFEVGAVQQDTGDSDNDPTTDQYIPISLASFTGQLPSGSKLADLTFRSADKAIDPITGLKDTSINFSETSVASGYGFSGTSASLKPLSFNLDVDGDGFVTPLGDGLMVIRYLFGNAFAGDALINKAISPDSPLLGGIPYASMTTQQKLGVASLVATNIQQGVDSNLLDVDKDTKTTALGDGLMVIRHLFGAAFAGAALTNKAISPDSPYFGPPANFAAVAANIDAMRPI